MHLLNIVTIANYRLTYSLTTQQNPCTMSQDYTYDEQGQFYPVFVLTVAALVAVPTTYSVLKPSASSYSRVRNLLSKCVLIPQQSSKRPERRSKQTSSPSKQTWSNNKKPANDGENVSLNEACLQLQAGGWRGSLNPTCDDGTHWHGLMRGAAPGRQSWLPKLAALQRCGVDPTSRPNQGATLS